MDVQTFELILTIMKVIVFGVITYSNVMVSREHINNGLAAITIVAISVAGAMFITI